MGDQRTFGTTAPGASTHGEAKPLSRLGIVWVFPFPTSLTTQFEGTRLAIGRSEDCDVVLAGAEISRHHAEVLRIGAEWVMHDRNSRNGIHVNGERLANAVLHAGDVLRLGEWVGIVRSFDPDPLVAQPQFRPLLPGLLGGDHLHAAVADAERVAKTGIFVVLQGETGVGKKQLAQALHVLSQRPGRFVQVNCSTLVEATADVEFFGGPKATAGTTEDAPQGLVLAAAQGTLLLENVVDLPQSLQPKLLRVLAERRVMSVGTASCVPIDVRVIATTEEPLDRAVAEKRLRADLCATLAGLTVILPALRQRREDIPGLFAHLLQRHWQGPLPSVDPRLVECLCRQPLPYNVRELAQLASYLGDAHSKEPLLRVAHLPKSIRPEPRSESLPAKDGVLDDAQVRENVARQELEKQQQRERELRSLTEALRLCNGNISRAATALGISRQKIYRLMQSASPAELEELRKLTAHSDATPANPKA